MFVRKTESTGGVFDQSRRRLQQARPLAAEQVGSGHTHPTVDSGDRSRDAGNGAVKSAHHMFQISHCIRSAESAELDADDHDCGGDDEHMDGETPTSSVRYL